MTDYFFIVGAQRCGTSYLSRMLDAHPEIDMAEPAWPETKFFLRSSNPDPALFEQLFSKPGARVRGEKSTSYIESELVAQRIANAFPTARVMMAFRNPVDRAISNYWFSVQNGVETAGMEEAFRNESSRADQYDRERFSVSPFAYLRRGCFIQYLRMWEKHFPPERIKVLLFERLVGSLSQIQSVYDFLGVDPGFVPAGLDRPVNASRREEAPVPAPLLEFLAEQFKESTRQLSEYLGDPLAEWSEVGSVKA